MKLVDDTVEVSVKHVRTFVHKYLSARLDEARSQIEQYGRRYTDAMLRAMATSKQGAAAPRSHTYDQCAAACIGIRSHGLAPQHQFCNINFITRPCLTSHAERLVSSKLWQLRTASSLVR